MKDERLDELLRRVPRDVPPSADLWQSIASQLEPRAAAPRPRRTWVVALAAGVATVALTALVTWQLASRPAVPVASTTREGASPATAKPELLAAAFEAPSDARYRAARVELEKTFRERLGLLQPETRQRIEQNLQIIRKANDDIRAALAADPNSPLLQQLLESTWQQEIDLYTTVNRTTDPVLPRNET